MPPRRCMDCALDATHTLTWHGTDRRWQARRTDDQAALHLYCHWHATVRVVQRNARGVLPPMQQLQKLLARPGREDGRAMSGEAGLWSAEGSTLLTRTILR